MAAIDALKSALVSLAIALTLTACASTGIWLEADTKDYKERLQTRTDGGGARLYQCIVCKRVTGHLWCPAGKQRHPACLDRGREW